ncbi:gliding motility-associated C-terminal domain-containing protein [Nafulsella turpanensis]|uniref:gliding motility-associated C-terminal domain-containing protein n=1 Tax=Nafulsella turpanensis TaxID=1265690 RepID=UPI000348AA09|nr:T9SS C-terminal target domain-containing protein [Nafulsella turpanensis]
MNFKYFFAPFLVCLLIASQARGQTAIADFKFEDTSDVPASLLKNSVDGRENAIGIHANAKGKDGGVYVVQDPSTAQDENLDLQVPLSLVSGDTTLYLEWEIAIQEDNAWLMSIAQEEEGFISGIYHNKDKGFRVRYSTQADAGSEPVHYETGWPQDGQAPIIPPLETGVVSVVGFYYNKDEGIAYLYVNGDIVWQTTDSGFTPTPGASLYWRTDQDYFTVASGANGGGQDTPFLFNFRIATEACYVAPPQLASETVNICTGETATLTASGGEAGSYRWYTSNEPDAAPITDETGMPVTGAIYETPNLQETTTYYVAIKGEECDSYKEAVEVIVQEKPVLSAVEVSRCGPGEVTVTFPATDDGTSYNWYSSKDKSTLLEKGSTSYSFTANSDTAIYAMAVRGSCTSGDPERIPIKVNPLPTIDAGPDRTILKGERVQLSAQYDVDSISSVQWSPSAGLDVTSSPSPWTASTNTITYTITGTTPAGCTVSDSVTITVIDEFPVTNAFSPNQDGLNDTWKIHNLDRNYPDSEVMVYNNWGNQVFYSKGYPSEWDGTFNGKVLPPGTYYYTIILNDTHEPLRGSLMIVK